MSFAAKVESLERKLTDTECKLKNIGDWIKRNFGEDPTVESSGIHAGSFVVNTIEDNVKPNQDPRPKKPKYQYERKRKLESNTPLQLKNKVIGISIRDEPIKTSLPKISEISSSSSKLKTLDLRDNVDMDGDPLNLLIPEVVMKEEPEPPVVIVDLEEEDRINDNGVEPRTAMDAIYLVDIQELIGSKEKQYSQDSLSKSKGSSTPHSNSTTPHTYSKSASKTRCQPETSIDRSTPRTYPPKPGPKSRCQLETSINTPSPRTYPKPGPKSRCQPNELSSTQVLEPRPKPGPKSRQVPISQQYSPSQTPASSTSALLAQSIKVSAIHVPISMSPSSKNCSNSNSDSEIIMVDENEFMNSSKSLDSIQPSIDPIPLPLSCSDYFLRSEMNGLTDETSEKSNLAKHVQRGQNCPICNKPLESGRFNLRNHMALHHPQDFEQQEADDFRESACGECGRNFTSLYNYKWHLHVAHSYPYDNNL